MENVRLTHYCGDVIGFIRVINHINLWTWPFNSSKISVHFQRGLYAGAAVELRSTFSRVPSTPAPPPHRSIPLDDVLCATCDNYVRNDIQFDRKNKTRTPGSPKPDYFVAPLSQKDEY